MEASASALEAVEELARVLAASGGAGPWLAQAEAAARAVREAAGSSGAGALQQVAALRARGGGGEELVELLRQHREHLAAQAAWAEACAAHIDAPPAEPQTMSDAELCAWLAGRGALAASAAPPPARDVLLQATAAYSSFCAANAAQIRAVKEAEERAQARYAEQLARAANAAGAAPRAAAQAQAQAALSSKACPGCGRVASKSCSACRSVRYCSVQCQRAHWNEHKAACRAASKPAA